MMTIGYFTILLLLIKATNLRAKTMDQMIKNSMMTDNAMDFKQTNDTVLVEMDIMYKMKDWKKIIKMSSLESDSKDIKQRKKRTAARGEYRRWSNNVIPYLMNGPFDAFERQQIQSAMQEWMKYTCLKFIPRQGHFNFIIFQDGLGCSSYIGMAGGPQPLALAPGCRYKPIILHELGHVIGFHHEHTRPDRDSFVSIHGENALFSTLFNFQRYSSIIIDNLNTPYDYNSIMHYGQYAFSINGRPTIVTADRSFQKKIGQSEELSFRDIQLANAMYKCSVHCSYKKCPPGGFLGKDCQCWCPGRPYIICPNVVQNDQSNSVAPGNIPSIPNVSPQSCSDSHFFCDTWAKTGECKTNPDYMLVSCKKSCRQCPKDRTLVASNVAVARQLSQNSGISLKIRTSSSQQTHHQTSNIKYQQGTASVKVNKTPSDANQRKPANQQNERVLSNTQRGATSTIAITQEDSTGQSASKQPAAPQVAANDVIPPGEVLKCQDENINCQSWAATNECEDKTTWMTKNCPVSCRICDPDCFDIWDNCELWAESGRCRHSYYNDLLQIKCRKTCQLCISSVL